jgi:hypothetical protein
MIGKVVVGTVVTAFVWLGSVPTSLTSEDQAALSQALGGKTYPIATFDDQIASIMAIQRITAAIGTSAEPIPLSVSREPADYMRWHQGACYDRSRFIEKALTYIGLETRHVFAFETGDGSPALAFLSPGTQSHAMTEVKTARGWMLVEATSLWFGLTADGRVITADMLERDGKLADSAWDVRVSGKLNGLMTQKFADVVGLYSRHGQFFWPYAHVPNVNWPQMTNWLLGT